jgi:hypothetical protein
MNKKRDMKRRIRRELQEEKIKKTIEKDKTKKLGRMVTPH